MLDHGHSSSVCGPYTIYVVLLLYVWCLYKGLVLLLYDTTAHSGKYLMVKGCKLGSGYYIYCFVEFYYTTPDNLISRNSIKNLFFFYLNELLFAQLEAQSVLRDCHIESG